MTLSLVRALLPNRTLPLPILSLLVEKEGQS